MANTRDIRNRIKSVKNTAQITRAMQLVAASKMKKAQDVALKGRDYGRGLLSVLVNLCSRFEEQQSWHPYLENREIKRRGILLVTSDRGLCGPLNSNLFRKILTLDETTPIRWFNIGRKGRQFLTRTQRDLAADFTVSDNATFAEVRPIIDAMDEQFRKGEIDTIEILAPQFINTLAQEPRLTPLVPLTSLREFIAEHASEFGEPSKDDREMLFEPSPEEVVSTILDLFIRKAIYQRILGAKASEHSARMVAMKSATDNAKSLVDDLTLEYNKARQAAITQEILEISAATFFN
ncbi:ATP synthase F1 subunit gamma [Puniceicoccus vermicola]|uniref:ATP synthase gamma chain n=1 Tax=Puniceicoccus vermicola TaxID=388746 RepID=A0A7X1AWB4_9BACT|nr:ATP synthase F1 subunit gamma [Puniceicoccus vermicola]MBC2600268.1 ATP synthase F1 subunit gamma [Puniceicoccus vermicola]